MSNYPICAKCNRRMKMDKMGVTTRVNKEYLQQGDRFRCPECGTKVVTNYGEPYRIDKYYKKDQPVMVRYDGNGRKKMELIKIKKLEQMEALLEMLGLDKDNLKCDMCGKKVEIMKCSVFPPLEKHHKIATITCDSPLCFAEYFTEVDNEDEEEQANSFPCIKCGEVYTEESGAYGGFTCDNCLQEG